MDNVDKKYNHFEMGSVNTMAHGKMQVPNLIFEDGSTVIKDFVSAFTVNTLRTFVRLRSISHNTLILSHNDPDGHGSSATIYFYEMQNDPAVINMDYNFDFSQIKDKLEKADLVYLSDLSLKQNQIDYIVEHTTGIVIWIDHHLSSANVKNPNKDKLYQFIHAEIGISAACLCYLFFKFIQCAITNPIKTPIEEITLDFLIPVYRIRNVTINPVIKEISLYDTFDDDMSLDFLYGFETMIEPNINTDEGLENWKGLLGYHFSYKKDGVFMDVSYYTAVSGALNNVNRIKEIGSYVHRYNANDYARHRKTMLGKFTFTIVKNGKETVYDMVSLNIPCFSMGFGEYLEVADGCIRYYQKSDGTWTYSCYSSKNKDTSIDCEMIASHFGGGGHKHASGWGCQTNMVSAWLNKNTTIRI